MLGGLVDDGRAGGRPRALKRAYCRLCWCQASLEAKGLHMVLPPFLAQLRHHQLFFAGMKPGGRHNPPRHPNGAPHQLADEPVLAASIACRQPIQLALFESRRDFTRFDRQAHANLAN